MTDTYFAILPSELLLELSLYFNYRDTILACKFLRCEQLNFGYIKYARN